MKISDILNSGYNAVTNDGMYTFGNFIKALNTLSSNAKEDTLSKFRGDTILPYTVHTGYGEASTQNSLDEFVKRAQEERATQLLQSPEVLGAVAQPVTEQAQEAENKPLNGYNGIGNYASDWYTSVGHADAADKARLVAEKAVQYGLDPYMALALGAQEGGWLGVDSPQAPNNYFGWGETDSGSLGMQAQDLASWLDTYFPKIVSQYGSRANLSDWGGSKSGYSARYNYNDSWYNALSSLLRQAENFRKTSYPDLQGSSINIR
jgi:hypothetical protein